MVAVAVADVKIALLGFVDDDDRLLLFNRETSLERQRG